MPNARTDLERAQLAEHRVQLAVPQRHGDGHALAVLVADSDAVAQHDRLSQRLAHDLRLGDADAERERDAVHHAVL